MARFLETVSPSTVDVDAAGVLALLDALEADPRIEPHGFVLLRHGQRVAGGEWAPYRADRIRLLYSLSKTFTGTALALAIGDGLLDLDDPISDHLPDLFEGVTDARTRAILVRHVASMATGHDHEMLPEAQRADPEHTVRGFLTIPPTHEPGTWFAYSQPATQALAEIVQRRTGRTLTELLRTRVFDPIGIGPTAWQQERPGFDLGCSGQHATTDAIARLGQLYLDDGVWEGTRILPAGWATLAATPQVATSLEENPDWACGYGFQLWSARHGFRGDGAFGQFMLVLPEQDAVLAITAESEAMQAMLDAVWAHLLPAFDRAGSALADAALAERTAGLVLPRATTDAGAPPAADAPAEAAADANPAAQLPALALHVRDGEALVEWGDTTIRVPVSADWQVVEEPLPVAASAAATPAAFTLDLVFLETPHRIRLTAHGARLEAAWRTRPLFAGDAIPLEALHAPR